MPRRTPDNEPAALAYRLDFLDGLRGLAALAVVLDHCGDVHWSGGPVGRALTLSSQALSYGRFAVPVFIVLSGYCLTMPVARSGNGRLKGGTTTYLMRRAWRILPPLYLCLLCILLMMVCIPSLRAPTGIYWDGALPAFTGGTLLAHLFMVHNLSPAWQFKIDPPAWTVATEWQIYFLFPFLLLPVWRRWGLAASTLCGVVVGLALHFGLHGLIDGAAPWYAGLFALGMAGAVITYSKLPHLSSLRTRTPWSAAAALLWLACLTAGIGLRRWWWAHLWYSETLLGITVVATILAMANAPERGPARRLRLILESGALMLLGAFSYSLYLIHAPVLALVHLPIAAAPLSPIERYFAMFTLGVPLALGAGYVFYLAFERPFIARRPGSAPLSAPQEQHAI